MCWRDSRDKAALTGNRSSLCDCERQKLWDRNDLWCKCRLVGLCCTVGIEGYRSFWCLESTTGTKPQTNQWKNPTTLVEGIIKMHDCWGSVVLATTFFCHSTSREFQLLDLIPFMSMFGQIGGTHFPLPETSPDQIASGLLCFLEIQGQVPACPGLAVPTFWPWTTRSCQLLPAPPLRCWNNELWTRLNLVQFLSRAWTCNHSSAEDRRNYPGVSER